MADSQDKDASGQDQTKSIWDNDLPAGDSPPMPKAPLVAAAVAYGCWLLFLLAMVIVRITYKA